MVSFDSNSMQMSQEDEATDIVNQILDTNMEFYMDKYMIPEVKRAAQAANVPEGFVNGIGFVRTGDNEGDVINTWGTEDLPLAKWFNYGTKDHGSKGNWPLRWRSKKTGVEIFARFVRGVPKTLAMEIGIELGMEKLQQEVPKIVEAQLA